MTRVLLVAPFQEQVIHNVPVYDNSDIKKIRDFVKNKKEEYGEITMLLFSLGEVRILKDEDEIPIPLQDKPRGKY